MVGFQSTLPRGERRGGDAADVGFVDFNPRSREGSDACHFRSADQTAYFNPRSREGSDYSIVIKVNNHIIISIHAPARGATTFR